MRAQLDGDGAIGRGELGCAKSDGCLHVGSIGRRGVDTAD
jgi:hypothetical protein